MPSIITFGMPAAPLTNPTAICAAIIPDRSTTTTSSMTKPMTTAATAWRPCSCTSMTLSLAGRRCGAPPPCSRLPIKSAFTCLQTQPEAHKYHIPCCCCCCCPSLVLCRTSPRLTSRSISLSTPRSTPSAATRAWHSSQRRATVRLMEPPYRRPAPLAHSCCIIAVVRVSRCRLAANLG